MSEEVLQLQYYGRIDYPQLVMRQLDRIAKVRSSLSFPVSRIDLASYYNALKTLYMIAPPSVREEVGPPPREGGLEELDEYLVRLRDALEERGLIGGRVLETGRPEVGLDADVHEEGD